MRKSIFTAFSLAAISIPILTSSLFAFNQSHALFDEVLSTHVKDGKVDYKALTADAAKFQQYLEALASVTSEELDSWSKEQKLAYWINAYNAYTIKAIVDAYPVKSIKKIPGVWKRTKRKAGGIEITLDDIEHKVLRAELKEPRIHFAINCASIGCPRLSDRAYKAEGLYEQLDASAKAMFKNREQFRINYQKMELHLSKILKWFGEDFNGYSGVTNYRKNNGIISFIVNYLPKAKQNFITSNDLKIKWLDYDWNLNDL